MNEENKKDKSLIEERLEFLSAKEYDVAREHPSPEQLLLRLAIEQLKPRDREIWDMYAYQQLTQEEIGERLGIAQPTVLRIIKRIETNIEDWCLLNKGAYMLLKLDDKIMKDE